MKPDLVCKSGGYGGGGGGYGGGGGGGGGGATKIIHIPNETCGRIIGKAGAACSLHPGLVNRV